MKPQPQEALPPLPDAEIEQAAQTLAACMDYPWTHMPQQGRETMRQHARRIVGPALLSERTRLQAAEVEVMRLDWLMRHISGHELRRMGIVTSAGLDRETLDQAIFAESIARAALLPADPK